MIDLDDPKLLQKMMQADAPIWAIKNRIRLMGNTLFTLDGCQYMGQIMRDEARFINVMKGTQARITTAFMLASIWKLIFGYYPQGVIYYFPSRDAVEDFSKTRFTPLINDNPCIKKFLKSTDSVFVKKVGKSFLTLKGATATKNLKGRKKDSMAVRSTPADEAILDERDLFDQSIVDMIPDRLLNSVFKRIISLGSPTLPDFGISREYDYSDQKNSMSKCEACNGYTCLVDEFPDCIKYKRSSTHEKYEPYFGCIKCGKPIKATDQELVAKYPGREISGYHIPHLITPKCEVPLVMDRWEEAQADGSKMGTFYNSILGLPYLSAEERLTETDVLVCCGGDVMRTSVSLRETAMGVDVGKTYHTILIGEKVDEQRIKVVYACRVKGFDAVYDISQKYNVKSAVICIRPYEEEFNKFRDKYSGKMRIFGSQYNPSYKQIPYMKTDENAGVYTLHRTQAFDKSHALIKNRFIEFPRKCEEIDVMTKQLCNCAKILEETEEGDRIYKYIKLGEDHYRSALNYLQIAITDLTHWQGMAAPGRQEEQEVYNPLTWGLN